MNVLTKIAQPGEVSNADFDSLINKADLTPEELSCLSDEDREALESALLEKLKDCEPGWRLKT